MNGKSKSEGLKQQKLTAFWLNVPGKSENNGKKRQREETIEIISPKKIALNVETCSILQKSPERKGKTCSTVQKSPERKGKKRNHPEGVEDIFFEDFENDPFLSPKKEKSPRKNVLAENFSQGQENRQIEKNELNFETPIKCRLVHLTKFTKDRLELELLLTEESSGKKGVCFVRDAWISSPFVVGDVLSVQAVDTKNGWVIDNKSGFVVLHPDVIINSTSLVASMFCMRQGLLQNFYKDVNSGGNDIMLIGRLVHEFFQKCLKIKLCSDEHFPKIIDEILQSRDYLRDLFFSSLKPLDIKKKVEEFVPHVKQFLNVYMHQKEPPSGKNFSGTIENIVDIEELIRSPALGLQGRVDVTVKIKSKESESTAPLELKTGRASFSTEHKSQLVLYVLLMNELGRKVESGLLLYLKEGIMEEIKPQRDEIRNLFLLRNHLVGFFKSIRNYELPDPIRNSKACNKCAYVRVCTSYLRGEEGERYSENHPLKSLDFPDIKDSHVDYFVEWNKMLWLEHGEAFDKTEEALEISGLKLELDFERQKEDYKHNFRRMVRSGGKSFGPGTFVHIVNEKSQRFCSGRILVVTDSVVSVLTDKKLEDVSETYKLVIFQSKFLNLYLSNLGWLLDKKYETLREIIIEKRKPKFQEKLDKKDFKEKCLRCLMGLNKEQQKAVLKCLLSDDYILIKGPPGTGKTQTIVALVNVLVALGQTVLLSGHTHSSVDNILLRLDNIEFLRLGALKSVHKNIHAKCYASLIQGCSTIEEVGRLFERKVIASTCSGLDSDIVNSLSFDVCIVDESSQVLQPEILRPLFCAKKFILVGDDDQLPPIVQNAEARKLGMARSLFERLTSPSSTILLKFQYRMNSTINTLANCIAYDGAIECADEKVAKATLQITNKENYLLSEEWIVKVLSDDLDKSVMFLDTSEYFRNTPAKNSQLRCSVLEANIILKLIYCLKHIGVKEETIGVITPFCDQIQLLRKKLTKENLNKVELNTVDQYQGRDKDVVLFSCSKENLQSTEVSDFELLNDKRRLTVAVTRAKHKFILVGDRQTVSRYHPFQKFIKNLNNNQFLFLKNGEKNFFWKDFDQ